ncbi:Putative 8-amino-7-oxononanoate synthase/2-amino-3-ketobutyrate coenzyme A ligase [Gluconacetobacter sp. SXCC-1]|uniref:8-amino-7-oxononanoate synthase n=2 Tax=Komagataeibacter rhaeticus TaxID=215221 RepID=A0A858JLE5_9PROT|nr:8-amino-7-oxononanoate synthase [Komagataeibacter rhaeticus]ATU72576.1 8-amino-7-oxononanoate synthase [Komagataeibacter xylinus]EGG74566.1 Putative 8-amino-7-oxononanoate synthase/2-amino-3-ketobutyrate coenzyme A ligase [Gluconacetobacter sp. SXCC-1]QIP35509.1 8-amino-7-oxononanoate synthase [Komagataeibacter rhaeticus]WPP23422.1 8-amino-7-oxononanoate synthase [Komagataeibacter rhaeticus]
MRFMAGFDSLFQTALDHMADQHTRRVLRPVRHVGAATVMRDGRRLVNFSANDYLGLAHHPALGARAAQWVAEEGTGAGASRLVTGTSERHMAVEARLAAFKGTQAALLLASGWQANASVLAALLRLAAGQGAPPLVLADRLNHASLHQGCLAAGIRQIRFRHNDLDHLESLLVRHADTPGQRVIVTESVFSMDGDQTDIARLCAIARRYNAFTYVDEAHATGVLGPQGRGLCAGHDVDLVMGTFSKALGGFGAYVAGTQALCDWLVNACSGFVFTTAPPPAVLGAMDAALELLPMLDEARARLARNAAHIRGVIRDCGLSCGPSSTQIIPVLLGDAPRALGFAAALEARGILATAIRPPTVPPGGSRIRLALSAAHTDDMIHQLATAIPAALHGSA